MRKSRTPSASLEREVIFSVIALYLLITVTMLGIHYLQPSGTKTETSSPSPSHESFRAENLMAAARATAITQTEAHALLTRQGYQEIRGLRSEDGRYRATAIKGGRTLDVEVDPTTRGISERLTATH